MSTLLVREEPTVFVVDLDPEVGQALRRLARTLELQIECYVAAETFLADCDPTLPGCIFLDLDLPGLDGLATLDRLADAHIHLPVVATARQVDLARAAAAIRAGARDLLQKPCSAEQLQEALRKALWWDAEHREDIVLSFKVHHRMKRLTEGEREVLELLIGGLPNKKVAERLELSIRAVEVRRAAVMRKMKAKTVADLVRLTLTERYFGPRR